jgi:hypothetical protein
LIRKTSTVAHQAAGQHELPILVDRRHRITERRKGELFASGIEEWSHRTRAPIEAFGRAADVMAKAVGNGLFESSSKKCILHNVPLLSRR